MSVDYSINPQSLDGDIYNEQNLDGEMSIGNSSTPSIIDQTYNPESENAQSGKAVSEAIANIKIPEISGEDGATFIPTISDEGIISWTNDKGLENPVPVNIKGPQGVPGEQGINGRDGLTPFINDKGNWQIGDEDTGVKAEGDGGGNITVDQTYSPESSNAQSGKAVAEAIEQNIETWELIEEITLTEDTKQLERVTDLNEKAYSFKKLMVQAYASTTQNSSIYFALKIGSSVLINDTLPEGTVLNNTFRNVVFNAECTQGMVVTNVAFNQGTWCAKMSGTCFPRSNNEYIPYLKIRAHTGDFVAGSTFKIYGVRA